MARKSATRAGSNASEATVHVGIGGWTYAPWRDNFYPPDFVQRRELEFASRHVTAIEVNGTFYGAQKPATYAKWAAETPDGFVFSLKAPRFTTNRKRLADAGKSIKAFVDGGLAELGNRLGPINWQMPTSKAFEPDDLAPFLAALPHVLDGRPLRHVLEVRHESFACQQYLDLTRAHGVATVFTDSGEHPSFADITGDFVYARLMRSASEIETGYPPRALTAWAKRASTWAQGGEPDDLPRIDRKPAAKEPRDVFIYFISAAKERNPAAAMALLDKLR